MVKIFPPSRLKDLLSFDADLIISCGFVSSCISAILPTTGVIKIAILFPGNIYADKFDLIITPAHDSKSIKNTKNVVTTTLSLTNESIAYSAVVRPSNIGLLMGGTNRSYRYTKSYSRGISEQIVMLAKSRQQKIFWTFSRRTPNYLTEYFGRLTSRELNLKYFERISIPDAVIAIFRDCDWVLVSADSISMITEALAGGCRVTVFGSRNRLFYSKRHKEFIDSMVALGAINSCEINQISSQVYPLQKVNVEKIFLNDRSNISTSIDQLLSKLTSYSSR
jgi:mitochondrial fission protein ELM1